MPYLLCPYILIYNYIILIFLWLYFNKPKHRCIFSFNKKIQYQETSLSFLGFFFWWPHLSGSRIISSRAQRGHILYLFDTLRIKIESKVNAQSNNVQGTHNSYIREDFQIYTWKLRLYFTTTPSNLHEKILTSVGTCKRGNTQGFVLVQHSGKLVYEFSIHELQRPC